MEPLRPKLLLCMIASFLLIIDVSDGNDFCTIQNPVPGDPQKPTINYSYSAEIMGKWFQTKNTKVIHEYYEKDKYLASTDLESGSRVMRIHDIKENTKLFLYDDECVKRNLDSPQDKNLEILEVRFQLGDIWKYEKETKLRGIKVKAWSTCSSIGNEFNFTAHYYFTMNNAPFRLDLQGKQFDYKEDKQDFHARFDYFMFTKGSPPKQVFNIPPGYICDDTTPKVTPPVVMSAFFREQEVDTSGKRVSDHFVIYDKQRRVMGIYDDDKKRIHDYNRGIQFEINRRTGECTRHALNRFVGSEQTVDNSGLVHMASLKHYLFADGNFTYNGVHRARGIPCDVYTKTSQDALGFGVSVVEVFFATSKVKVYNDEGSVSSSVQPPVRVLMKGGHGIYNTVVKRQFDIYDFDPEETSSSVFVLSDCFDEKKTIIFKIILKGKHENNYDRWYGKFSNKIKGVISDVLGISYLRVDLNSFKSKGDEIEMNGVLFAPESPITKFQTVRNMEVVKKFKPKEILTYKNQSNTPTICSDYCDDGSDDNRPSDFKSDSYCYGFEFDRSNRNCNFFFAPTFDKSKKDENLQYSSRIDFYRRIERTYTKHYVSLYQSWRKLQTSVKQGLINITYRNGNFLKADSVTKVFQLKDDDDNKEQITDDDNPMSQFKDISETVKLSRNPVEVISRIFKYACARHCLNTLKYNCEAFRSDEQKMICSFYDSNEYKVIDGNAKGAPKNVFIRLYLSNFEEIPGRSMLSADRDSVYTAVTDPNACAELCSRENEFYCQSFEICGQTCLLGRNHIYNTPRSKVKEAYDCIHYSRNYIQDYIKQTHRTKLSDSNVVEISNIGVKKCASLCSTSAKYNCNVFEFCDSDSICRLSTKSVNNAGALNYKKSGDCSLYSRKHDRNRFINSYSKLTSHGGGHSPGSMGGIAIGMIIVGMLLILVVVYVILKLRSTRNNNDQSIGFSKKQLDDD